jgi:hypothetical protein
MLKRTELLFSLTMGVSGNISAFPVLYFSIVLETRHCSLLTVDLISNITLKATLGCVPY